MLITGSGADYNQHPPLQESCHLPVVIRSDFLECSVNDLRFGRVTLTSACRCHPQWLSSAFIITGHAHTLRYLILTDYLPCQSCNPARFEHWYDTSTVNAGVCMLYESVHVPWSELLQITVIHHCFLDRVVDDARCGAFCISCYFH